MIIPNHPRTPRRGNENIAQGNALGGMMSAQRPERAKAQLTAMLLLFQGDGCVSSIPKALPWAMGFLAFQAVFAELAYLK